MFNRKRIKKLEEELTCLKQNIDLSNSENMESTIAIRKFLCEVVLPKVQNPKYKNGDIVKFSHAGRSEDEGRISRFITNLDNGYPAYIYLIQTKSSLGYTDSCLCMCPESAITEVLNNKEV